MRYLLPLGVFFLLLLLLAIGLTLNPREIPSPLIDRPAPAFSLKRLHQADESLSPADLKGQVWLLNVWASWCVACREEHPLLVKLAESGRLPIIGLNYKDENAAAKQWLQRFGDPYHAIAVDGDGRAGIDWGVYGVPESFLIDAAGVIRYKHIGPLTAEAITGKLLPMIDSLEVGP